MAKKFTAQNFESEVLQAKGPVLVDFWATWCMPCRMQGPAIEKLAEEGYNAGKLNVDEEQELAALIALGWPDIKPEAPKRKTVEQLLRYI